MIRAYQWNKMIQWADVVCGDSTERQIQEKSYNFKQETTNEDKARATKYKPRVFRITIHD